MVTVLQQLQRRAAAALRSLPPRGADSLSQHIQLQCRRALTLCNVFHTQPQSKTQGDSVLMINSMVVDIKSQSKHNFNKMFGLKAARPMSEICGNFYYTFITFFGSKVK